MDKKTLLYLAALAILLFGAALMYYSGTTYVSCSMKSAQIEKALDDANRCSQDSDCDVIMLGGEYIEFGCYHYVNKDADKESILQMMQDYGQSNCMTMIDKCGRAPNATCDSGKCVSVGR